MHVEIAWLAGAGFRLEDSRGRVVFIDPWMDAPPGNPGRPAAVKDVRTADLVLVTHGDPGHYGRGDGVRIAHQCGCVYAANEALSKFVVSKGLLPPARVRPLEFGKPNDLGVASVVMFPIVHPPWTPPAGYEIPREPNTGFVITLDGVTILFAGDTVLGDDVYRSVCAENKPLVGLLPIGSPAGSHGSIESTVQIVTSIAEMTGAKYIIPHYNYVSGNPALGMLRQSLKPIGAELIDLDPGEAVRIDAKLPSPAKFRRASF